MPDDSDAKDKARKKKPSPKEDRPRTDEVDAAETADEGAGRAHDADDEDSLHGEDPLDDDERGLFGRFTRRLRDRRELTDDAWKAIGTVLSTSDRAKSEFIRMLGREVRHYLDGLQLTDDLRELVTNHSLEVHASLSLKPLAKSEPEVEPEEDEEPE